MGSWGERAVATAQHLRAHPWMDLRGWGVLQRYDPALLGPWWRSPSTIRPWKPSPPRELLEKRVQLLEILPSGPRPPSTPHPEWAVWLATDPSAAALCTSAAAVAALVAVWGVVTVQMLAVEGPSANSAEIPPSLPERLALTKADVAVASSRLATINQQLEELREERAALRLGLEGSLEALDLRMSRLQQSAASSGKRAATQRLLWGTLRKQKILTGSALGSVQEHLLEKTRWLERLQYAAEASLLQKQLQHQKALWETRQPGSVRSLFSGPWTFTKPAAAGKALMGRWGI